MSRSVKRWLICLFVFSAVWFIFTGICVRIFANISSEPSLSMCQLSVGYIVFLLFIMLAANIARVRMIHSMIMIYCIGVAARCAFGLLDSLLIIDKPQNKLWFSVLNVLSLPFHGLMYIASKLTSHFIVQLYFIGVICICIILFCLASAAFMAVSTRNRKINSVTKQRYNQKEHIKQAIRAKKQQEEENLKLIEQSINEVTGNIESK